MALIIKIQSVWRGKIVRKQAKIMRMNQGGGSRYFTLEEFKETVTDKVWDPNQKSVKKKVFTYKSGAKYDGEWKGGF
jgi:hypothetical protein